MDGLIIFAFIAVPVWIGLIIVVHYKQKEKERGSEEDYKAALRCVEIQGKFKPAIHNRAGINKEMLIATDERTTQIALVELNRASFPVSLIPFDSILDVAYGEDASVRSSSFGMLVPVDGMFVGGSSGSASRTVSSRWVNLFVDSSLNPRITLYMPDEATAQRWYDLVRLGIARHGKNKPLMQEGA